MFYAVTDQRVLIVRGANAAKFKSLDIRRLPKLDLTEHRDGTGTIELDGDSSIFGGGRHGFGVWTPTLSNVTQFFRIENPRYVYELIRDHSRG